MTTTKPTGRSSKPASEAAVAKVRAALDAYRARLESDPKGYKLKSTIAWCAKPAWCEDLILWSMAETEKGVRANLRREISPYDSVKSALPDLVIVRVRVHEIDRPDRKEPK